MALPPPIISTDSPKKTNISALPSLRRKTSKLPTDELEAIASKQLNIPPPLDLNKTNVGPLSIPLNLPPMPVEKIPESETTPPLPSLRSPRGDQSPTSVRGRGRGRGRGKGFNVHPLSHSTTPVTSNFPPPPSPIAHPRTASIPPPNTKVSPTFTPPSNLPPPPSAFVLPPPVTGTNVAPLPSIIKPSISPRFLHTGTRSNSTVVPLRDESGFLSPGKKKVAHLSDPLGSLNSHAKAARELHEDHIMDFGKQIRNNLTEEDKVKLAKLMERGDITQYCVKDSELATSNRHSFFEHLNPLDVESETFVMYAQRRFPVQHQKKHLSKKQVSVDSLIMYTQKKLSNALHSFELKETQKAAIELFEKINQCISDSKKGDDEDSLIQNLIDFLMKKPELGNEAYCQLFKQMSGNPKSESVDKGWHLMAAFTNFVSPTSEALPCIGNWLHSKTTVSPGPAWFCLQSLQKSLQRKHPRKNGPSLYEIQSLKNFVPMLCRLCSLDGSQKAFYVDSSTTVTEAINTFCNRISLPYQHWQTFCVNILRSDDSIEQLILTSGLIGDVLRILENVSHTESKLCLMPFLFINRSEPIKNVQFCSMLFEQLRREYLSEYLPVQASDAVKFGGLILQYLSGDHKEENNSIELSSLIPASLLPLYPSDTWTSKIQSAHLALMGTSKEDCKMQFVSLCQTLKNFGLYHTKAEFINMTDWKDVKNPNVNICVSEDGLSIFDETMESPIYQFDISNIARWHLSPENTQIEFSLANRTSPIKVKVQKPSGHFIVRHLHGYVTSVLTHSPYATALIDHHPSPEDTDLLPFDKGDIIHIVEHNPGNGWEFGTVDGVIKGNFPLSAVQHTPNAFTKNENANVQTAVNTGSCPLHEEIIPLMVEYVSSHFRTKKLETGYSIDLGERFTFTDEPVTHSLLKMSSAKNTIAVEMHNLFLKYLQTNRVKYVADAVKSTENSVLLKNELFCQAIRHTLSNTFQEYSRAAWEWLTMISLAFNPPDNVLVEILLLYLELQGIEDKDQQVVCLARHCLLQVNRRRAIALRTQLPSMKEFESVIERSFYQGIKIKVIANNSVSLIDSCSTAEEVATKIGVETLRLPCMDNFGLLVTREKGCDIPVSNNTILADLLASRDLGTSKPIALQMSFGVLVWRFQYVHDMNEKLLDILYSIFRQLILNSDMACSLTNVLDLAGFMLLATAPEEITKQLLPQYLPRHLVSKHPADSLIHKLTETYTGLSATNLSVRDAKLALVRNASEKYIWNWSFFPIVKKKSQGKKYIGVSSFGIGEFSYDNDLVQSNKSWEWENIKSCTMQDDNLLLTLTSGAKSYQITPTCVNILSYVLQEYQKPLGAKS